MNVQHLAGPFDLDINHTERRIIICVRCATGAWEMDRSTWKPHTPNLEDGAQHAAIA